MRIGLPYGKSRKVSLEVPDRNVYFVVDRGESPALKDLGGEVRRVLRSPIGAPPLSEAVHRGDRVVILVDDGTRPTPQGAILPVLLGELNAAGVPDRDIEVVVALGTHENMGEAAVRERFGVEVAERVAVVNHDYRDPKGLVSLGRTGSGTPISLSRDVHGADYVIGVGNIVPHCYTGWGGGGKIVQPGVCGEETTAATHWAAGKFRPIRELAGNLDHWVRREVDAVAVEAGLSLIVNTVLNHEDEVSHLVAGHAVEAFREGVRVARRTYCPRVPGLADVVVVSSYPADLEYWQAIKPLDYAHLAVKPGGTVVLITPSPSRVSTMHPLFREGGTWTYEETVGAVEKGGVEDIIAAGGLLIHAQIRERCEVVCYSDGMTEGDKEALGFRHAESPQEALDMALKSQGKDAKVGVLRVGEILPVVG